MIHWTPDSWTLLYVRSDRTVMSVSRDDANGSWGPDRTEVVALGTSGPPGPGPHEGPLPGHPIDPGGEDPNALPEPNRIVLITNWFGELTRRMEEAR